MAYNLFEVFGVELEYMIVDRDTMKARPIADLLIEEVTGSIQSDVERGALGWSNELVSHVIELKTNGPAPTLKGLSNDFLKEVEYINEVLRSHNAVLMPTGAHPFFDPKTETVIWPHEYNEVYALYDRIFNCVGHGWSNLQSTHLNLPFNGDEQFGKLHAAIRVILPIIPALCASTPVIEGKLTGLFDTRLEYYRKNQQKIPEIAGLIIPEEVFDKASYERDIFQPIKRAITPYDTDGILDKHFLNSRGAIARFDRGAIEIRLIDIQECPRADLAIVELIVASLQGLIAKYEGRPQELRHGVSTERLSQMLTTSSHFGSRATLSDSAYLSLFGLTGTVEIREIWAKLFEDYGDEMSEQAKDIIGKIIRKGNLSERMFTVISDDPSRAGIESVYRSLTRCLENNELYIP
jgi:gamma-glutamyl:cysteine ligase YbdK (ATP-grasp superfamily)